MFDYQVAEARDARLTLIEDCFDARTDVAAKGLVFAETVYNPLPVDRLYVTGTEFDVKLRAGNIKPINWKWIIYGLGEDEPLSCHIGPGIKTILNQG